MLVSQTVSIPDIIAERVQAHAGVIAPGGINHIGALVVL
jgi:hypothetical protein